MRSDTTVLCIQQLQTVTEVVG